MTSRRLVRTLAVAGVAIAVVVRCALLPAADTPWKLPPLNGEFSGTLDPLLLPGAPALRWTVTANSHTPRERAVTLAADGEGTRLHAEATLNPALAGAWRITEAELDLATWFPVLAARVGGKMAATTVAGKLRATGAGTVREATLAGALALQWRDGRLENAAAKFLLEGVTLDLAVEDLGARRTAPAQRLAWTGGRYDVLTLGPGHVVFRINGEHVAVTEAAVRVAGGELFIDTFEFSLAAPEPSVRAHIIGAQIAELLPLLPTVITAGTGRVDGSIELHWEPQGLRFGAGRLVLATGSTAEIKLAPTPGLISGSLPPAVSQYYDGILDLELGRMPIRAHVLEATFDPAGDAEGRTATVRLEGGPADPRLRAPVELSVNVRGPLESLLRLGMDSRLHFGGGR